MGRDKRSQTGLNAFQDDIRDCIDAGMNAHIAKPIESKKIEDTLQLVLKQKMQ